MASLTFEEPDLDKFPCLTLARTAMDRGGNTACVINAANEVANLAFRQERLPYSGIYAVIADTLERVPHIAEPTYEDYVATNAEAVARATERVGQHKMCNA